MNFTLKELTRNIDKADVGDILSCWQWLIGGMKEICLMTILGDLYLVGKDNKIYWLQTDKGELTPVANDITQFREYLEDESHIDNWFLPKLIEELIIAGKTLKESEVYSYLVIPVLGGDYGIDNIIPTDISVHFAFSGQICEQIKDLPDGTNVPIKIKN